MFTFSDAIILRLTGRDVERYLHSRLTANIKTLKDLQVCLAACLSPQGKTQALFRVFRHSTNEFLLIALAGEREQIIKSLKCFIVADRVELEDLSTQYNLHLNDQISSHQASLVSFYDSRLKLHFHLIEGRGSEISNHDLFLAYRLNAQTPEFPWEVTPDSLFAEAEIFDAVSNTKGCYAGQEVMERVVARGKLPATIRKIFVSSTDANIQFDLSLETIDTAQQVGQILSYCYFPEQQKYAFFARILQKYLVSQSKFKIKSQDLTFQAEISESSV